MSFWKEVFFPTRNNGTMLSTENSTNLFDEVFGHSKDNVTDEDVLGIPIVNACITRISDIVGSTELKLYKKTKDGIKEVYNDDRVKLINTKMDNGMMTSFDFRKRLVTDYYLKGHSYFYIDKRGNKVKDIMYLDGVSVSTNSKQFNKLYTIYCEDRQLRPHQLLRFTRNSKNGITGKSIVDEAGLQFLVILRTMERMLTDIKRGFLPKGFFKLERNVSDMEELKNTVKKLLSDEQAGYMIFNRGVEFESLEKKKDAEKEAKANTQEINRLAAIFGVPVSIITGGGNEEDKFSFINFTILPLLATIEASLNRDLLLESEQGTYFFGFETKELMKGNLYERFKAYEVAIKNNILSMDEVRDLENMERLNFGFYKMNIADAFYYKDENMLVNVNSGVALKLDQLEVTTDVSDFNTGKQHTQEQNYLNNHQSEEEKLTKGGEKDESKSLPRQSDD